MLKKQKIGIVHGRFQPFHLGHLEYVLSALKECEHLIIGITNPDPTHTKKDSTSSTRAKPQNNPFSYYERYLMIREALLQEEIPIDKFDVVPFPINYPELLHHYIPSDGIHYTRVFEPWNYKKIEILKELGHKVVVLFEGTVEDKQYIGGEVRKTIADGGTQWKDLVPKGAAQVIKELDLDQRLADHSLVTNSPPHKD